MDWTEQATCRTDPDLWASEHKHTRQWAALQCIQVCEVFDQCRAFAARHRWQGVTVAGWSAPRDRLARPPQTIERSTA